MLKRTQISGHGTTSLQLSWQSVGCSSSSGTYQGGRLGEQDIHSTGTPQFQNNLDFREGSTGDLVVSGEADEVGGV